MSFKVMRERLMSEFNENYMYIETYAELNVKLSKFKKAQENNKNLMEDINQKMNALKYKNLYIINDSLSFAYPGYKILIKNGKFIYDYRVKNKNNLLLITLIILTIINIGTVIIK